MPENWGECRGCRFFGVPEPAVASRARCNETTLHRFSLVVTGNSGCNHFSARTVPALAGGEPLQH